MIGRDQELAAADDFLARARERFGVLLLEGEPGIGKTTVWQEVLRRAEDEGFLVLSSRPAATEAKLSLSALADLLNPVAEDALEALPGPQRRAVDVALLRAEPGRSPLDPRLLGTAVRSLLARLAGEQPVLVGVDDVQWLDTASAAVLEFAGRRLANERVAFVLSRRIAEPSRLSVEAPTRVTLGPLSLGAVHQLLKERLGRPLSRSALVRVHETSGGNPLFAVEVARMLLELGVPPAGEPLPVPSDIYAVVAERVRRLPAPTREVLLAAASLAEPSEDAVRRAVGRKLEDDLEPADRAGIATLQRGRVVFAHPLFAAAVASSATAGKRRRLHGRLAEIVDDEEARARHLALAAERPDERTATLVHAAAHEALARGAPAAAAELAELALGLGEAEAEAQAERLLDLADFLHAAGEPQRAQEALEDAESWRRWPAALQARRLDALGDVVAYTGGLPAAVELGERMLNETLPAEARAIAHTLVSYGVRDAGRALEHADAALALLTPLGDDVDPLSLATALYMRLRARVNLGYGLDRDAVDRIVTLEARLARTRPQVRLISFSLSYWFKHVDDIETSRAWLERDLAAAVESGHETARANTLTHLAVTECFGGNLGRAREFALAALAGSDELGLSEPARFATRALALVEAHVGDADAVLALVGQLEQSESPGDSLHCGRIRGLLELSLGNYKAADAHLGAALTLFEEADIREPGMYYMHGDAAEAAVAVGDLERAQRIADFLQQHGERSNRRWSLATAARVRALIAAARNDVDGALAETDVALERHNGLAMPLERARTLLVKGVIERRLRRRAAAKESFEQALDIFETSGARLWAERTRAELDRLGLRRSSAELTENERRVAELAAEGLTNREVAAALFISPKTVAANLSRVYDKLAISSRAELGARMGKRVQT